MKVMVKITIGMLGLMALGCATRQDAPQQPDGQTQQQEGPGVGAKILLGVGAGLKALGAGFAAQGQAQPAYTPPPPVYQPPQPIYRPPVYTSCYGNSFGGSTMVNCTSR